MIENKKTSKIRLSRCALGESTLDAVKSALDSSYLGMGELVERFENKLSDYFRKTVVTLSSGTSAIHLAIECLDFDSSSEVIVPSITYVATFQAIKAAGVIPVACDVDPSTGQICIDSLESLIGPRTKAVVPVHYAGNSFSIDRLYDVAKRHNLRVIEDAAHAFGSIYNGKKIGSIGDVVCFSFDGIKNITTGEGGCVVTDDQNLIELLRTKRGLGVEKDFSNRFSNKRTWIPQVKNLGWRAHMSNINASIGLSQMEIMSLNFAKRKELVKAYSDNLSKYSDFIQLMHFPSTYVPHIYPILVEKKYRDQLRDFLNENNIESGIHYYPNHLLDLFKTNYELKNANEFYSRTLSLPLHPFLDYAQINYIISVIELFINSKK